MLVQAAGGSLFDLDKEVDSLAYALKHGIASRFSLWRELGVERVGHGRRRAPLCYKAAEVGVGVFCQQVGEPVVLEAMERAASRLYHFGENRGHLKPDSRQACKENLLTCTNQLGAHVVDRRLIGGLPRAFVGMPSGTAAPGDESREALGDSPESCKLGLRA